MAWVTLANFASARSAKGMLLKQYKKTNPSVPSEHGQRVARVTRGDSPDSDIDYPDTNLIINHDGFVKNVTYVYKLYQWVSFVMHSHGGPWERENQKGRNYRSARCISQGHR
jgi:hypothetical protein